MNFTRAIYASTLAAGVGLVGLFGAGLGTASADPGQCNMPNQPQCGQNQHNDHQLPDNDSHNGGDPAPVNWQGRGVDKGRQDHQPFNWNGQQVTPMPAGNGAGWGFWFLGAWIPL
ncbi:hypothetical protein EAH80_23480 [Mycobacterium hodleri]|uniref:Chitin-binding protein n=2 Tax=Mycolicibacterium hodleri TaxID=49897 RepID=A0A502E1C4_9MYCO|nr:hypothetical protein [Mycolicibacterium hodleri]TPG31588.1 hypothetical protein EAH80_23480 [Mycolicibacterium hodleri]